MFKRRMIVLSVVLGLLLIGAMGRLMQIQIMQGEDYRLQGEKRLVRLQKLAPARGRILDAKGRVIAKDVSSFELWLTVARYERVDGKRVLRGLLGEELQPRRLVEIARSRGAQRQTEIGLAVDYLVRNNSMVRTIAEMERRKPQEIAVEILKTALRYAESGAARLTETRPCLDDVQWQTYLHVMQERENPFGDRAFDALESRTGFRRIYLDGDVMGHITGVVGRLNENDYRTLRGYWNEDGTPVPGSWEIRRRGHVFFKIDPDGPEADMIRLREIRRAGKTLYFSGFLQNETVGRTGVEAYYNQQLRGEHAWQLQRLTRPDPNGPRRFVNIGKASSAVDGKDIRLTIDLEMQKRITQILREEAESITIHRRGAGGKPFNAACILLDPRNGRVLAMVSIPGYDPNTYREDFAELLKDPRKPLINRVIAGRYPPGSIMKPIVGIGALHDGLITPSTTYVCEGSILLAGRDFVCFRKHVHGTTDVTQALQKSCNVFFYHVGEAMKSKRLYDWAWKLGIGHRTGIDMSGEASGLIAPNAATGKRFSLGETYHLAIGQGRIDVTPLQMAVAYAAIANGGNIVQPHVVQDEAGLLDQPRRRIRIDEHALNAVREGMWKVVNEPGGTAYHAKPDGADSYQRFEIPGLTVAGKTRSAEHTHGTHAWFACYAPFENPEVVCVVIVPEGNYGGQTSSPIARRILMEYFGAAEGSGNG